MRTLNPVLWDLKGTVMNAYHSEMTLEPLNGTLKEKVNTAEKGFSNWVSKFFEPMLDICESPIHMIGCLDDGNTFRKAKYPLYKASRDKKESDPLEDAQIKAALEAAKQFLAALGVPLVRCKGEEADDLIAYLRGKLKGQKTIVTLDKDLVVLSGEDCGVFRNGKLEYSYGDVPNHLISLYLSIVGDSADGYPGVRGAGPAAWAKMVEAFGIDGMEQLLALAETNSRQQLKSIAAVANNKTLTQIAENYDEWRIQFLIAQLHPELCEGARNPLEWYKRAPTSERLMAALSKIGAEDLFEKYEKFTYKQTLVTKDNLDQCLKEIEQLTAESPAVAYDYETYDTVKNPDYVAAARGKNFVDVMNSGIAGCSFALGANMNHVYYLSVAHANTDNVPKEWVFNLIKHFEDEGKVLVAQNISFEATVTKLQLGHEVSSWEDTKAYAHHIDENNPTGLKHLSKHYLNYTQVDYNTTLANAGAADMSEISGEQVLSYGCDDSLVTAHLYSFFTVLTQLEGTYDFCTEYECPAVALLKDAYIQGVKIDPEEMARQAAEDSKIVEENMAKLRALLSEHCTNPNFEGVEALYEDQKAYITVKADPAKVSEALARYRQSLKDACRYVEPYEVRDVIEFLPTPAKLSIVAEHLGLPPIEKVTKTYMTEYLSINEHPFCELLGPAVNQFKVREGEDYDKLKEFCNKVYYDLAKPYMAGTELNLGSPPQMTALLYLLLGLPIRVRTKVQRGSTRDKFKLVGAPATDETAVEFALANDCEGENSWKRDLLKCLLDYKSAATRLSIYWGPYPLWAGEDNILHPSFINPGTVTRRPTGSMPNLLQVSKGDVRKIFVPRSSDNVIVSVDFASQELRVLASLCQDANFLSAYTGEKDKDLHALTACGLLPMFLYKYPDIDPSSIVMSNDKLVDYDWFKEHQDDESKLGKMLKTIRGYAKTANFGIMYASSAPTMSQQLMIPLADAEVIVSALNVTYPGIQIWKEKLYTEAKRTGYVQTCWGSRRHIGTGLTVGTRSETSRWERQAANFVIQATCADLLKVALVEVQRNKTLSKHAAKLIAPIYDEMLFEVPKANVYQFLQDICNDMERPIPGLMVPMVADCSIGPNWGYQIEVGNRPTQEVIDEAIAKC